GAYATIRFNLAAPGKEPERIAGGMADQDFMAALGVAPTLGRGFTRADMVWGANHVVVLSDALWRRDFGRDSAILNRTIQLNDVPYTVIGVAPAALGAIPGPVVWVPASFDPARPMGRRGDFLRVIGRLKPGVTVQAAQRDASRLADQLSREYPATNDGVGILVQPLRDVLIGSARVPLVTFAVAVGLLLLIACGNVANLMLARGTGRRRELVVRVALGAPRSRLVAQLLADSAILSLGGGVLGLVFAYWGMHALRTMVPSDLPRLASVQFDPAVLAFAAGATLVTGVLFGLVPAIRAARGATYDDGLTRGSRGFTEGGGRLRAGLVLAQTALALVLAVGAGLLARSYQKLQAVDLGFDGAHVFTAQMLLPPAKYATAERLAAFFDGVRASMGAQPGVQAAGLTSDLPLVPNYSYLSFAEIGRPAPAKGEREPDAILTVADSGYFAAMGIRLVVGRGFTAADRAGAPHVALVSQAAVDRYWAGVPPIGHRITFGDPADSAGWSTIVGVTANTRLEGVGEAPYPQAFVPMAQAPQHSMYVVVRTAGDPATLLPALRRVVKDLDPGQPIADVSTMAQRTRRALAPAQLNSALIAVLSLIALALAGVGIYGVVAYTVAQRRREIAIRLALGATGGQVLRSIVQRAMLPAVLGVGIGLAVAVSTVHLVRGLLFDVSSFDPVTLAGAAALLLAVAAMACLLPGLRAARVSPLEALAEDAR
ncbi:MAG TPA: ABC transporter permease, partial [Gemmatimonadaceae bacterium]|nr:ABC transporter permease [Gemmatimonadaceae bacterium]